MKTTVENLYGVIAGLQEEAPVLVVDPATGELFEADISWDYVLQRDDGSWVTTISGMENCVRGVVVR